MIIYVVFQPTGSPRSHGEAKIVTIYLDFQPQALLDDLEKLKSPHLHVFVQPPGSLRSLGEAKNFMIWTLFQHPDSPRDLGKAN